MILPRRKGLLAGLTALTGVAARASNQLVLLVVTMVATRFLGPSQFGVFAIAAACTTLVRTLLYSGAFEYLLKATDVRTASTEALLVNLGAATVFSAGLLVLAFSSHWIFGSAQLGAVLLWMIPSNFFASATAWQEVHILRSGRVRLYYLLTFLTEVASGALAIGLFFLNWGLGALVAQIYARAIFLGLGYLALERPALSTRISAQEVGRIVQWSRARYLNVFVNFAYVYGADFVLTLFLTTGAAGLYRASDRIVTSVSDVIAQPTRTISMILFSKRVAAERSTTDLWPKVMLAATVVAWPAMAGLASVSGSLVPLVLGPKWVGAAPIVSIICLLKAFGVVSAVTNPLLVAHSRQKFVLWTQVAASSAALLGLIVFARFGVPAAAWTITTVAAVTTAWQLLAVGGLFEGSRKAAFQTIATVALPTAATALAAHACLALAPALGHPGKWVLTAYVVGGGALAWLLAALLLRGRISQSVLALNE